MIGLEDLHRLPLQQKFFVMEALWDDLSQIEGALPVPEWQKETLDEREVAIASGPAAFIDWEDAKREIRASVK
ncbi:MAG: uncharacterized protein JWR15_1646 [Prosthecobacter sp.]|nr:uncharacterized protein [Prosthecobacter sp.]